MDIKDFGDYFKPGKIFAGIFMHTKKSALLLLLLTFSFRFVFSQKGEAIRFVYRNSHDRPPHPTLAICLEKLKQPDDAGWLDSLAGSAILTDSNTYKFIRAYILSGPYANSVKDVGRVDSYGTPMCPISSPALEIKDSSGMDIFVCSKDWRPFFDTLRAKLQQNHMDPAVIITLKNAPAWPRTPTNTKKYVHLN